MAQDTSPTARALLVLELVQGSPGITADRLAPTLGVCDLAARRYVGIRREAPAAAAVELREAVHVLGRRLVQASTRADHLALSEVGTSGDRDG